MRALAQANSVRLARAELKRRVAVGEISVTEVVLDCRWEAASMSVAELLLSQHRWGAARCRRLLASIPLGEAKTIGSLTQRQRLALAQQLLGERGGPRRPARSERRTPELVAGG